MVPLQNSSTFLPFLFRARFSLRRTASIRLRRKLTCSRVHRSREDDTISLREKGRPERNHHYDV